MRKKILLWQRKQKPIICKYVQVECRNTQVCYRCDILKLILKEKDDKIAAYEDRLSRSICNGGC